MADVRAQEAGSGPGPGTANTGAPHPGRASLGTVNPGTASNPGTAGNPGPASNPGTAGNPGPAGPGPRPTAARAATRVAVTRERIVAVAVDLFAERGFAGTSVRDISEALGVTKAALYYHFTSKDEILDAIVNPVMDRLEAFVRAAATRPDSPTREVLADLVDVLAATASALSPFANDPSVLHHSARTRELKPTFEGIVQRLAGTVCGPFAVLRVRCAIGALQAGVFSTLLSPDDPTRDDPTRDDPAGGDPARPGAGPGQPRRLTPTLSPQVREQIVDAAIRTLGEIAGA